MSSRNFVRALLCRAFSGLALLAIAHSGWGQIWVAQGPSPTTGGQVEGMSAQSNPVIGAIHTLAVHPTNPDVIWIGSVNGGIWKTTNATSGGGPTWTPLTDFQSSLSIGALALDPTDATNNTLVAGIGRFSSLSSIGGARTGLLRTTNGGTTWTPLTGGGTLTGKNISGVAARGSTLVVSVNNADVFSTTNFGIFRSTNSGTTFTKISSGVGTGLPGGRAFDLVGDPSNSSVLYTAIRDAGSSNGIYKSSDTGATWARVSDTTMNALVLDSGGTTTSNIEMSVGTNNNVYAGVINNGQLAGLFRSGNGGTSWTQLDTPTTNENGAIVGLQPNEKIDTGGGQGSIHFSILADPGNANVVYLGGDRQPLSQGANTGSFPNSIGAVNYTGRLFRVDASLPSGSQAIALTHNPTTTNNSAPHADSREMAFAADGSVIETDDGGIYRRSNPRTNNGQWTSLAGNLLVAETHSADWDHNTHTIIAGTQDGGTTEQITTGGATWRSVNQGDGGRTIVDDSTPGTSVRYSSSQNLGGLRRRTMNSSNVQTNSTTLALTVNGSGGQSLYTYETNNGNSIQFYTPLELNAINHNLYIGTRRIYESTDQGNTVSMLADLGTSIGGIAAGGMLNGVPDSSILYVSAGSSLYLRSTAGGSLSLLSAYAGGSIRDIVLNPTDWHDAFVVSSSSVWQTIDAGLHWSNITANLGTSDLRTVEYFHSALGDVVLVGGQNGIYRTYANNPTSWTEVGAFSLPNVEVYDLHYDAVDNVLLAATIGRGTWTLSNASIAVPEPATWIVLAGGSLGLLGMARRRRTMRAE